MLLEIFLALLLGTVFGTFTGLTPGIHINLIGASLVSLSATLFSSVTSIYMITFIVAMAITHTFIDFIPSVLLGCPDTDTELSILPGHQLLKEGRGYEAILLTAYGSLAAVFILLLISYPSIILISKTYIYIKQAIPFILIAVLILLVLLESKKLNALVAISLTGLLGLCVLNLEDLKEPLLPLLTGLFGSSMLIMSIKNKIKIPKQEITYPEVTLFKPLLGAVIAAPICSFLPGLGSGQAAIIGNSVSKTDNKGFLILLGATNTLVMGFSFIALYTISRTRTGAAAAIQELIGILDSKILLLALIVILISGVISFFLLKFLARLLSEKISKISYTNLSSITLSALTVIILTLSGFFGFFVFAVSTLTGIYCISLRVRRTNMMGCLLIPTILFYLL